MPPMKYGLMVATWVAVAYLAAASMGFALS
jgi:hypothetical protein